MNWPTFERIIVGFMLIFANRVHCLFVLDVSNNFIMEKFWKKKRTFNYCEFSIEDIEVTLEKANCPSRKMK